jgi:catechol 2,3-dioxygenase-like lactoylglutathione lyase family enzyme
MTATLTHKPQFQSIGVHTADLDRALRFFSGTLGLDVLRTGTDSDPLLQLLMDAPGAAPRTAELRIPRTPATIRIVENPGAPYIDTRHQNPGTCHFAFYTHDLDRSLARLAAAGSRMLSTHVHVVQGSLFDGGKVVYCSSPDGWPIELMQGPAYLDGTPRDPNSIPDDRLANETCHLGWQVRDLGRSLAFYRDLLGIESLAEWLEATAGTQATVGLPGSELNLAVTRLPGTPVFAEVIEYQKVPWTPVDTHNRHNGTYHMVFRTADLDTTQAELAAFGSHVVGRGPLRLTDGSRALVVEDPDQVRVVFVERRH